MAIGADRNRAAELRCQHHDAHDALAVHPNAILQNLNLRIEGAGQAYDARSRTGVQSFQIDDGRLAFDHNPSLRKRRRRIMANRAKRTEVRPGPNQRISARPATATPAAPIAADQPKPARYQFATTGTASPTVKPASGPAHSIARGNHEDPMAFPTRIPAAMPVRSDHTAVPIRIAL